MAGRGKAAATVAVDEAGDGTDAARPEFDLYSQPWIPVVRDGVEELVSLRTAITEAHQIDGLSTTDGPRFAGLLRLLVALVMDVYGQPANDREWAKRREQGRFHATVLDDYVAEVGRSRFDLFDAEHPFMQSATTPPLSGKGNAKSVAELLTWVATGNRTPLWTPDIDARPRPLAFTEAAQALVAMQAVAVPGLGRATKEDAGESWAGLEFGGRVGVIGFSCPVGETLFETAMLNIPNGSHKARDSADLPVWRRPAAPASRRKRPSNGMVDLLTWTPRRVRLVPNGDTVSRVCFLGGDALPALELDHEPHTALMKSDDDNAAWKPRKHRPHTLGWRGIPQLLALGENHGNSLPSRVMRDLGNRIEVLPSGYRVTVLSLYVEYGGGAQKSVFDNIVTDMFPLPVRAFGEPETDIRDLLVFLVTTADQVRYQLFSYASDVYAATHRDLEKDRKASKAYATAVEADLVSRIDTITRRLLSRLSADPSAMEQLRWTWTAELGALADAVVTDINTDCGPGVFALISATSAGRPKVQVYPPAIRQAQLRAKLDPLLGRDHQEVTT
jgi:CRISPR type I-E-associated protein CasA/Cse1